MKVNVPLVMIHGFLSGPEYWSAQVPFLEKNMQVVPVCLKGFGDRSDETAFETIQEMAKDVMSQLALLGIKRFHLIGHSMGGMVAQQIGHKWAEQVVSLTLYGTGPKGDLPGRFEPLQESIKNASSFTYGDSKQRAVSSWFKNELAPQVFKQSMQLADKVSFQSYLNGLIAMNSWNGEPYVSKYRMPVLIIWADSDKTYPWDEQVSVLWKGIEHSSMCIINDCAHNAHIEKPLHFNVAFGEFLQSVG